MRPRHGQRVQLWLALLLGLTLLGQPMLSIHASPAPEPGAHCGTDGASPAHPCCPAGHPCGDQDGCVSWCVMGCNAAVGAAPLPVGWTLEHAPARRLHPASVLLGPSWVAPPPERPPRA